ncbi:MAG: C10 family peptidase [Planctomycetota bacterium]
MKNSVIKWASLLIIFSFSMLPAEETTSDQAARVVENWLKRVEKPLMDKAAVLRQVVKTDSYFAADSTSVKYYVVSLSPKGYVVVSPDDSIFPVIAFSSQGSYVESANNPLTALLSSDMPSRLRNVADSLVIKGAGQNSEPMKKAILQAKTAWKELSSDLPLTKGAASVTDECVLPLLQSRWGQDTEWNENCYNYYTPNNYVCGCVATAGAQIMRYFRYGAPQHPTQLYNVKVDGVPELFKMRGGNGSGGAYSFNLMPYDPPEMITIPQRQMIGNLCYDFGLAVSMSYTEYASGAYMDRVSGALVNDFGYSNAIFFDTYCVGSGGIPLDSINCSLDSERPLGLSIEDYNSGHAIVCDGYGYNYSVMYHHLNLGWTGDDDAWYNLPFIDGLWSSYDVLSGIVYNIYETGAGEIISGRVFNSAGNPIAGVSVRAQSGTTVRTVSTNSRGIYAFEKLPSDTYYDLTATRTGYQFLSKSAITGRSEDYGNCGNVWGVDFFDDEAPLTIGDDLDNVALVWTTSGSGQWFGQTATYIYDNDAAQTGAIGHSQNSALLTTFNGAGAISFYWKVSSEEDFDELCFYIDNTLMDSISGTVDWERREYTINEAGNHTLRWMYSKDYTQSDGMDCGWVDRVELTHTIHATADSYGTISPSGDIIVDYGSSVTFAIAPDANYRISDVEVDGSQVGAVSSYTFDNVSSNHTISASFEIITHTITASANENGLVSPNGSTVVVNGTDLSVSIIPNPGYEALMIVIDGVSDTAALSSSIVDFLNINDDHTLAASFKLIGAATWTLTASTDDENGRILPGGDVYAVHGGSQSFTLSASEGYHVDDVRIDGLSIGAPTSFSITHVESHHTIIAYFKANVCTISGFVDGPSASGIVVSLILNGTVIDTVTIGESGYYLFNDVPWGDYQISFYKSGCVIAPSQIDVTSGGDMMVLSTVTSLLPKASITTGCGLLIRPNRQFRPWAACLLLIPILRRVRLSKRIR